MKNFTSEECEMNYHCLLHIIVFFLLIFKGILHSLYVMLDTGECAANCRHTLEDKHE